jgi:predicted RecA/RadA family phage recombinase
MATNQKYTSRSSLALDITFAGAQTAGNVVALGSLNCYVLEDTDASNKATCILPGITEVVELSVVGENNAGNTAISAGDKIYNDSGTYNADATNGFFIGYALAAVGSGDTTAINVALAAGE